MKTVTYILNSEPDRGRDLPKVVDLEAWKAEHLAEESDEPRTDGLPARRGDREPARRRWTALDRAELTATLAVAAAFLALAVRVLFV